MDKTPRPQSQFLTPVIFSVLLGLFAGAVGTMLVLAYGQSSVVALEQPLSSVRISRVPPAAEDRPEWADLRLEAVSRATALIYKALPTESGSLVGAFIPSDAVGAATVLTSDGWLLSHESVLGQTTGKNVKLFVVVGGRVYPVRTSTVDPYSGAAFLRIDASNLPVASFGDDTKLSAGDNLYAMDAVNGLRHLEMTEVGERPAETAGDYVVSSERLARVIRTTGAAGIPNGAAAVSRDGGIVGIYAGNDKWGASVIPLSAFFGQISTVLRDGKTLRPTLGVRTVDLSRVAEVVADGTTSRRGAEIAVVTKRGPAETANLRVGDTITAVGNDEITANRALADILAEYDPGTAIVLSVRRGTVTRQVNVRLGTAANQVR
jgi:putative serine protease PepD